MSIRLMSAVWPLDLPATDKMVLLALADAANDEGVTWIAVESRRVGALDLSGKCSLVRRTVQQAIVRLCAAGLLARTERPGRGVLYKVTPAGDSPRQKPRPADDDPIPASDDLTPAGDAGNPSYNRQDNHHPEGSSDPSGDDQASPMKGRHLLPEDWALPAAAELPPKARACAQQWAAASYETHGEAFIAYWRARRGMMADWRLTWASRIVAIHGQVMRDEKYGHAAPGAGTNSSWEPRTVDELSRAAAFCEMRGDDAKAAAYRARAAEIERERQAAAAETPPEPEPATGWFALPNGVK